MKNKEVNSDMNVVDQMYANFCKCAKGIPGFKIGQKEDVEYDITDLANGYVKAMKENDSVGMNQYISALMVRYWHLVPYLWDKSKSSKLDMEDMVMWIYDGFAKAFKYQSWLDPSKAISKDPKGAEKCFNQCITSVRQHLYRHFNTNQSKINYVATSLDALYDTMGDAVEEEISTKSMDGDVVCREIISSLVSEGKIFDAIVVDKLCFDDSFKETKHSKQVKIMTDEGEMLEDVSTYSYELNNKKLASCLKAINDEYIKDFSFTYGVSQEKIKEVLNKYGNKNVGNNIQNVLSRLRTDEKVLSLVC